MYLSSGNLQEIQIQYCRHFVFFVIFRVGRVFAFTHIHINIHIHIHINIHLNIHINIHIHLNVHIIYTYTYKCIELHY